MLSSEQDIEAITFTIIRLDAALEPRAAVDLPNVVGWVRSRSMCPIVKIRYHLCAVCYHFAGRFPQNPKCWRAVAQPGIHIH